MNPNHYDQKYFEWQRSIGRLTGRANLFMYQPYIGPEDRVVDFGCGGGFLLKELACKEKCGIEINPVARDNAIGMGIAVVASADDLTPGSADVVISSHALEHTFDPLGVLVKIGTLLKPGGRLVLVTPFERDMNWKPNDINQHLFTWSPMNLGNLATKAGYVVETCEVVHHRFPPGALLFEKYLGKSVFHLLCRVWGLISRSVVQVRVVAVKP